MSTRSMIGKLGAFNWRHFVRLGCAEVGLGLGAYNNGRSIELGFLYVAVCDFASAFVDWSCALFGMALR